MATRTINPQSNPYGGGAVVFDSTPYVEYYLREQQKEDAKNEALDKYYQDEMSKLSPAGMREQDVPIFSEKFNKLKEVWVKNKEAIKNPTKYGFEKAQEYERLRQELSSMPTLSKELKQLKAEGLKITADPTKRELVDIPTFSELMMLHDLPINDPRRKSLDLINVPFLAKEMTPQEKMAYQKSILGLAGKDKKVGQPTKIGKFEEKVIETEKFSDENLKTLGDIARKDALTNKNLARTAKLDFERITPEMKLELNELHNQIYKRPIQSAEDLAAASIIQAGMLAKKEEEDIRKNEDALQAARDARTQAMIFAKNSEGQLDPYVAVDMFYDDGKETNVGYRLKTGDVKKLEKEGNLVYGREITLPREIEDDLFDKRKGNPMRPAHTVMSHDKKKVYLIYKNPDTGELDESKTRTVNVGTDLVASIAKNFGGTAYSRKNLFTRGQQPQKNTTFVFPEGKPKKF